MSQLVNLAIPEQEQIQVNQIAAQLGLSVEKVYLGFIHEGLVSCQQRLYFEKLKRLSDSESVKKALALLDKAPDIEPLAEDSLS